MVPELVTVTSFSARMPNVPFAVLPEAAIVPVLVKLTLTALMPAVSLPLPVAVILPALLPCRFPTFRSITTAFALVEVPVMLPEALFVTLILALLTVLIPLKSAGLDPSSLIVPLLLMVLAVVVPSRTNPSFVPMTDAPVTTLIVRPFCDPSPYPAGAF